jgi:hypothetical protein
MQAGKAMDLVWWRMVMRTQLAPAGKYCGRIQSMVFYFIQEKNRQKLPGLVVKATIGVKVLMG